MIFIFIYWHDEEVLYPNYVEVILSLTTTKRKCLWPLKMNPNALSFLGEMLNTYVTCQLRQASCTLEVGVKNLLYQLGIYYDFESNSVVL